MKAYYAGFGGDGHWGRLNVTHQFYQAFGDDEFNGISGQAVDINAQFAAVELSIDQRLVAPARQRSSSRPATAIRTTTRREGFDAIHGQPEHRRRVRSASGTAGHPAAADRRRPRRPQQHAAALRSSKTEGQASFVNPGLLLYNAGFDAELTTKLRTVAQRQPAALPARPSRCSALLFQGDDRQDDRARLQRRRCSIARAQRQRGRSPAGVSVFTAGSGFKQILTSEHARIRRSSC